MIINMHPYIVILLLGMGHYISNVIKQCKRIGIQYKQSGMNDKKVTHYFIPAYVLRAISYLTTHKDTAMMNEAL